MNSPTKILLVSAISILLPLIAQAVPPPPAGGVAPRPGLAPQKPIPEPRSSRPGMSGEPFSPRITATRLDPAELSYRLNKVRQGTVSSRSFQTGLNSSFRDNEPAREALENYVKDQLLVNPQSELQENAGSLTAYQIERIGEKRTNLTVIDLYIEFLTENPYGNLSFINVVLPMALRSDGTIRIGRPVVVEEFPISGVSPRVIPIEPLEPQKQPQPTSLEIRQVMIDDLSRRRRPSGSFSQQYAQLLDELSDIVDANPRNGRIVNVYFGLEKPWPGMPRSGKATTEPVNQAKEMMIRLLKGETVEQIKLDLLEQGSITATKLRAVSDEAQLILDRFPRDERPIVRQIFGLDPISEEVQSGLLSTGSIEKRIRDEAIEYIKELLRGS